MKILVTGGNGFIGSTLVDKLINLGHKVRVIDNLSAETHNSFYYNDRATYHNLDIVDYDATKNLYVGVDYVFHLAAESRIQPSISNPIQTIKTNVLGTEVVLQCARESNVKKVIYSSTSSAYGKKNKIPLAEHMPNDCLNPYSVSKVAGEELCKMYHTLFGLNTIILRYFNVYGDREPNKGPYAPVVGLFLRQAQKGQTLTIVPNGTQRRDFTHVDDVISANILAMDVDHNHYGEIFNVGTGKNHSVLELADMISKKQTFIESRLGEAIETLADNSKIQRILGWTPGIKIEDYILNQLKY